MKTKTAYVDTRHLVPRLRAAGSRADHGMVTVTKAGVGEVCACGRRAHWTLNWLEKD